jgi:hypothetical protein
MKTSTIQYRTSVLIDEGYTTQHEVEQYMPETEMFVAWLTLKWQERTKKSAQAIGEQINAQDKALNDIRPQLLAAVRAAGGWEAIEKKYGARVTAYLKKYEVKKRGK